MRTDRLFCLGVVTGLFWASVNVAAQTPLGTGFTYQGQLKQGGVPLNGTVDLEFSLWDAETLGNRVGSVVAVSNVNVVNGLFQVGLDFGAAAFDGDARWLQIDVRSPAWDGVGTEPPFTALSPRQAITPTPYALALPGLRTTPSGNPGLVADSRNIIGGHPENQLGSGVAGATIGGGGFAGFPNQVTAS